MKINKDKYELARARKCMGVKDIVKEGISKTALYSAINGNNARPETIGKIAKILNVDAKDIVEEA